MIRFCSLGNVRFKDWLVKASSFDDQILLVLHNPVTMAYEIKMFYNEEDAYVFIEGLTNDSSS